tara:strand:- start:87 stop:350 length:264 start_codon:yes stop_codon:yes gene_type:complete
MLLFNNRTFTEKERLAYFASLNKTEFSRKEYMDIFKDISSATASRDLIKGVEKKVFNKIGKKTKPDISSISTDRIPTTTFYLNLLIF